MPAAPAYLPRVFLVLEKRGRSTLCCTTHELNALNLRLRDAATDCMVLTEHVCARVVVVCLCVGGGPLVWGGGGAACCRLNS